MKKKSTKLRVAIYARVSKKEKQEVDNQLFELRSWGERMGHEIHREYIDRETGAKGKGERKEFTEMFTDASQRKFDLVLFWALDRFTREGLAKTIFYLQQLDSYGILFHSFSEEYLNTDNEMVRNILLSVLASLAKQERQKISDRTKAGLATARRKGKRLGQPTKEYLRDDIAQLVQKGLSKQAIAKKLKVSRDTVYKYYPAS